MFVVGLCTSKRPYTKNNLREIENMAKRFPFFQLDDFLKKKKMECKHNTKQTSMNGGESFFESPQEFIRFFAHFP